MSENGRDLPASEHDTERADRTPPAARPQPIEPGQKLGRYIVERSLGAGGYGQVYLARDLQLNRAVAVKILHAGARASDADANRFLAEARRLAQLRHAGIMTVFDSGVQDGLIFVVSDYLEGPNLHQWVRTARPDWREIVRVVADIADALAYAHARATVHRDVKPENVIIVDGRTPVLIDFGLGLDEHVQSAEVGLISGTYQYMAPEQTYGQAHRIDGRTDVYGLGIVLYQLLSGRVPFRSFDRQELLRQIQEDEPQPLRQLAPALPPALDRICLKALAKRVQDRHTTAADFADDLRRLLQDTRPSGQTPATASGQERAALEARLAAEANVETAAVTPASTTSSRRRAAAERRQVTMLACSAAGLDSATFFELDAEDQVRLRAAFDRLCEETIDGFGGAITERSHHGLVACFGYPVAYEDAARRAATAGMKLLDELTPQRHPELAPMLAPAPAVQLHTGGAIGEVRATGVAVAGDAANVAARLHLIGEPGAVVCTSATHALIHDYFHCVALGPRGIRGVLPASDAYRVVDVLDASTRLDRSGPDRLTPLIGRDHEVGLLLDRWKRAADGMGQVVQIIGEAGLGKSRLVYTLKQHLRAQAPPATATASFAAHPASASEDATREWAIVEWRCSPQRQASSLYPVVDFFDRLLDRRNAPSPEAVFDRLVAHLEPLGMAGQEVVPLFASLLSLPLDARDATPANPPAREREAMLAAIRDWLRARAELRTVLFVVEDLQWIDASTLEVLHEIVAGGQRDRILSVLTFRPEFKTPWPAAAHHTTLPLTRLGRREVAAMLERRIESSLPQPVIDQLWDRTGGVPLFVEEFAQLMQESGALGEVSTDTARIRLFTREIPTTLQDLVMARLGRVAGGLELAQLAATLGREFSHEVLAAVSAKDDTTLRAELAPLLDAEILYQKGRPPRSTYIFKHALLEDAAYNSLVKSTRQQYHQRVAETLEAAFPQTAETSPELLAHHFAEAGLAARSVEYWLKAGLRARQRSADVEAIASLTSGLTLLKALDESAERDRLELQFQAPLVTALIAVRGYPADDVGPVLDRARVLCERIGDRTQAFVLAWSTWVWRIVRGEFRLAVVLADQTVKAAQALGDPGAMRETQFPLGATRLYRGDFAGARACFEEALAGEDPASAQRWTALTGHDLGVTLRCNLALALWYLGAPEQARQRLEEALAIARRLGQPFHLGYVLHHSGWLHHNCRLAAQVEAAGDAEIDVAVQQGSRSWHATGRMFKAAGMLLAGRIEGVPLFLEGLQAYRATGHKLALPYYLSILGQAHMRMGRFKEAFEALDEGIRTVQSTDDHFQEAELHRLKGEALLMQPEDHSADAEQCFRTALSIARRQQGRAWELRTATSLARLWQQQRRDTEARALLGTVFARYTEGMADPDLADAAALLTALGAAPRSDVSSQG